METTCRPSSVTRAYDEVMPPAPDQWPSLQSINSGEANSEGKLNNVVIASIIICTIHLDVQQGEMDANELILGKRQFR